MVKENKSWSNMFLEPTSTDKKDNMPCPMN